MQLMLRATCTASLIALAASLSTAAAGSVGDNQPLAGEHPAIDSSAANQPIAKADEIVVMGNIRYRNRSDGAEPVLVYDQDYFQRFEPLTAGDALKRVPSVTFLSDVIESDGARLRGLAPSYTQILINGEKVPGSSADRSFFMDRIPAELISRVEIVRSSSARRSGDAMAGTLNIVLRDGLQLDGGYVRVGGLHFRDNTLKPSLGAVWGGDVGPGRLLLGANIQGRYNPKLKTSLRYTRSPEQGADWEKSFDNREDQHDTRNGTDYSANASYELESDKTKASLSAFVVRTDRRENERSYEYTDRTARSGPPPVGKLLSDNANVAQIDQLNYSLAGKLSHRWGAGKTSFKMDFARFDEDRYETEYEIGFNAKKPPAFKGKLKDQHIADDEFSTRLEHEFALGGKTHLVVGAYGQHKARDTDLRKASSKATPVFSTPYDQFAGDPTSYAPPFTAIVAQPGGDANIEESRKDLFGLVEGTSGGLSWEAGVRWENTDYRIRDNTVAPADRLHGTHYDFLLPSASLKLDVGHGGRLTASVARTTRRPGFNDLSPATLAAELGDNDLVGNPDLRPETAWGGDLGFEQRIGRRGIAGINVFYRDVRDLIEHTNTGREGSEGKGTYVFQPRNVGDGKVYGVEFDLSTDLAAVGLKDTGVFANISWLDSEISDTLGKRRFNGQSNYVYNVGFIQDIPAYGVAFGATHRKQGKAIDRTIGEDVVTRYGADLEVFVEKRFGKRFTIRAVGSNLLDGRKEETFHKYTTIADQKAGKVDEYELESERAGPVFQLMARYAF